MPDHNPDPAKPREDETPRDEQKRVRTSNDWDQQLEREGASSRHNRGYDEASGGRKSKETDPDSPDADVDRDDMIDEP